MELQDTCNEPHLLVVVLRSVYSFESTWHKQVVNKNIYIYIYVCRQEIAKFQSTTQPKSRMRCGPAKYFLDASSWPQICQFDSDEYIIENILRPVTSSISNFVLKMGRLVNMSWISVFIATSKRIQHCLVLRCLQQHPHWCWPGLGGMACLTTWLSASQKPGNLLPSGP